MRSRQSCDEPVHDTWHAPSSHADAEQKSTARAITSQKCVDRVAGALERGDIAAARATWTEAIEHLFAPAQPFHAATHDALALLLPAGNRKHADLRLPRPGAPPPIRAHEGTVSSLSKPASSVLYAGLPDNVVLHLLAEEWSNAQLIALICEARPSTLEQLAELLEVSLQTVRRHCLELIGSGRLTVDASGRYTSAGPGQSPAPA